ncbi:MAG: hypothetical protein Q9171_001044 [Xanthocarpia ochracea]
MAALAGITDDGLAFSLVYSSLDKASALKLSTMEHRQRVSPNTPLPFQQLLNHNNLRVIENPLRRVAEEHVINYVRDFHEDNHLDSVVDVATCIRGALLARQEEIFTTREGDDGPITEVERAALEKEKRTSIWTDTRELKIILLSCSLGSVLQGWVSGGFLFRIRHAFTYKTSLESSFYPPMMTPIRYRSRALSSLQTRYGRELLA